MADAKLDGAVFVCELEFPEVAAWELPLCAVPAAEAGTPVAVPLLAPVDGEAAALQPTAPTTSIIDKAAGAKKRLRSAGKNNVGYSF